MKGSPVAERGVCQTFIDTHCDELAVWSDIFPLTKLHCSRVRGCMKGKRTRFPFSFAAVYPGDGKRKVGLSVHLERAKKDHYQISMRWFITDAEPPEMFGKVSDLFPCLAPGFGQRRVNISATFTYPTGKVGSVFRPIQLATTSTLFDEIVGFSGIKRDSEGKFLYGLTVSLGETKLSHVVRFMQRIELTEDLPVLLLPRAQDISTLALERRERPAHETNK